MFTSLIMQKLLSAVPKKAVESSVGYSIEASLSVRGFLTF
jgi:hypothetical protein